MKQKWKEFEIKDFKGLQSSTTLPDVKACKDIMNFDTREIDGALVSRNGFVLKYSAPTLTTFPRTKLSNLNILSFENLYTNGQEVTILVASATLSASITVGIGAIPSKEIITIWASHSWNGSAWVEGWDWLNECVLTQLHTDPANNYQKNIDYNITLAANYFAGWTIYNESKNDIAKIIKSSTISSKLFIDITNKNNNWEGAPLPEEQKDVVLLMRNYIPLTYLVGNAAAERSEIVFHKVYDQLRIGFGGYADRLGLAVFFHQKKMNIQSFDFYAYSPTEINTFIGTDRLAISPYTLISDTTLLELSSGAGNLEANTYYFHLTGIMGDSDEVDLGTKSSITLSSPGSINYVVKLKVGPENLRLTQINVYYSANGEEYFHIKTFDVRGDEKKTHIDSNGYLALDNALSTELHAPNLVSENAASTNLTSDPLTTTGWGIIGNGLMSAVADNGAGSINAIEFAGPNGGYYDLEDLEVGSSYVVSFYVKATVISGLNSPSVSIGLGGFNYVSVPITTGWVQHTIGLKFEYGDPFLNFLIGYHTIRLDRLSINLADIEDITTTLILGDELEASLGYAPTRNIIKSWDQAIVTQGRTYFVNAFIDQRYTDIIFFSAISGQGANMYDVAATTTGWIDLEKFDGNDIVGAEVYSNMDFHIGRRNAVQRIDPITQQTRDISFGDGVLSRRSLVNFGNMIAWASEYGIKGSNGIQIIDLTKETIYDTYKGLDKENIIAIRDENGNAYMFYGYSDDIESGYCYVLTKKGWIKFGVPTYPTKFSSDKDGNIWFLHESSIFMFNKTATTDRDENDGAVTIRLNWESVEQDIYKIEQLSSKQRFYIGYVWAMYKAEVSNLELKVYLNASGVEANPDNKTLPSSAVLNRKDLRLPNGANCKLFSVSFGTDDNGTDKRVELQAIGIGYKILPIGNKNDKV